MIRKMNFETGDLGAQRKPLVLVVDDEVSIADTCAMILERNGLMAMVAYDAKSALKVAAAFRPDLLLSDVGMPGINGIDLAQAIKQVLPQCSILLFSGQASSMDLLKTARDAGHELTVLSKPLHPAELIARVSGALQFCIAPNANAVADQQIQIVLSIPDGINCLGTNTRLDVATWSAALSAAGVMGPHLYQLAQSWIPVCRLPNGFRSKIHDEGALECPTKPARRWIGLIGSLDVSKFLSRLSPLFLRRLLPRSQALV